MSGETSFKDVLREKRRQFLAVLLLPIVGMLIALVLIIMKRPDNLPLIIAVVFFLMVQYGVTVVYINSRMEKAARED